MAGRNVRSPGEALVEQLKWVHDMIRRDLRAVRKLAGEVADGRPGTEVRAAVRSLATNGPLFQLRVNCLQHCHFVHSHHHHESAQLFPVLRKVNPALNPVVDKLEADHRAVADLLDQVEGAARALGGDNEPEIRRRLVVALNALSVDLLAHLQFEEENIADTLRMMRGWP